MVRDPDVSVPRESGLNPAATPTAEPVDEPPGAWYLHVSYARAWNMYV